MPDEILKNADSSKAIPPLYGALLKMNKTFNCLKGLFMSRRESLIVNVNKFIPNNKIIRVPCTQGTIRFIFKNHLVYSNLDDFILSRVILVKDESMRIN